MYTVKHLNNESNFCQLGSSEPLRVIAREDLLDLFEREVTEFRE